MDPVGRLTLRNVKPFKIEIHRDYAAMQVCDEHGLVWNIHLSSAEKLLQFDARYFIRLMKSEQLNVRIKIQHSIRESPKYYFCDKINQVI